LGEIGLPRDRYSKIQAKNRTTRLIGRKPRFLTKPLRKCPNCRQDAVVEIKVMEAKVVVQCINCFVRYEFTKFPVFEEIDYYNKMLDIFRSEKWARRTYDRKTPVSNKNEEEIQTKVEDGQQGTSNCPICKLGNLRISNYFVHGSQIIKCNNDDCSATFTAPKSGFFEIADNRCVACGWPVLVSKTDLAKLVCFNPKCGNVAILKKWQS
jgi:transcription elongation factor Elf1/predicted RNA-binding Zn-ribbon protein involved in translation (DUF1610 family)